MTDERLLTAEEQAPFTHTDLVEYGEVTVGEEVWDIEGLLKSQLAKADKVCPECGGEGSKSIVSENLVDRWSCLPCKGTGEVSRPEREKLEEIALTFLEGVASTLSKGEALDFEKLSKIVASQIIALLDPDQIRRQERERIWAWGHLMCDTLEHTNILLPKEMGGGTVKINNRRRRRCVQCWGTLLNEQELKSKEL